MTGEFREKIGRKYLERKNKMLLEGKVPILEPDKIEKESIAKFLLKARDGVGDIKGKIILDVGCGRKPYAVLFNEVNYIGLDLPPNDFADIYGDALYLPFKDCVFDIVISTQVIEHVKEPEQFLREIYRVLKPNGILILTAPFVWWLHDEPHDYFRFTKYGLKHLLTKSGFKIEIIEERGRFLDLLCQRLCLGLYTWRKLPSSPISDISKRILFALIQVLFICLSKILPKNKSMECCLGYGVIAKK